MPLLSEENCGGSCLKEEAAPIMSRRFFLRACLTNMKEGEKADGQKLLVPDISENCFVSHS